MKSVDTGEYIFRRAADGEAVEQISPTRLGQASGNGVLGYAGLCGPLYYPTSPAAPKWGKGNAIEDTHLLRECLSAETQGV